MFALRKLKAAIRIELEVYEKIVATLGSQEPEQGGYLISKVNDKNVVAVDFIYDFSADTSAATYSPDTAIMSPKISKAMASGKLVTGVVHTHPDGYRTRRNILRTSMKLSHAFKFSKRKSRNSIPE